MLVLMHARAHAHAPARWWVVAVVAADPEKATLPRNATPGPLSREGEGAGAEPGHRSQVAEHRSRRSQITDHLLVPHDRLPLPCTHSPGVALCLQPAHRDMIPRLVSFPMHRATVAGRPALAGAGIPLVARESKLLANDGLANTGLNGLPDLSLSCQARHDLHAAHGTA
jgi:hypothetical protein